MQKYGVKAHKISTIVDQAVHVVYFLSGNDNETCNVKKSRNSTIVDYTVITQIAPVRYIHALTDKTKLLLPAAFLIVSNWVQLK